MGWSNGEGLDLRTKKWGPVADFYEHGDKFSRFRKAGKFLDQLNDISCSRRSTIMELV